MGLPVERSGLVVPLWLVAACLSDSRTVASPQCPQTAAVASKDGSRRLALIVGVSRYRDPLATPLPGASNDAKRMYDLLTRDNGYGFPKANVCLLLDEDATVEGFKSSFARTLVDRAQLDDVAFVFFAGHGSQVADDNRDEPDEMDETLVFNDSRSGGVPDLVDDEFNAMLARLSAKTRNIVVILDSCNSGTATRGADTGTFVARYLPPAERLAPASQAPAGDGSRDWAPENLPGLVFFAAATDGTSALETRGNGVFSDAVVQVLSAAQSSPLFYSQAARLIPPLVAARSYQIPMFHGQLDRPVFANTTRARPVGWEVIALGPPLQLSGPPLPGLGVGAELRIYPGNVTGGDARDPGKGKATVVVDAISGLNADAHVLTTRPDAAAIAVGDIGVFVRASDQFAKVKVRLRPRAEPGGLADDDKAAIESAIAKDEEARLLVEVTTAAGDFELSSQPSAVILRGPENRIRNSYSRPADSSEVARHLWLHSRQRALLQLQGETGSDFKDNATLRVRLKPATRQEQCAKGAWTQAEANEEQVIPLCHRWKVEVTLDPDSPLPLLVGGLILSNDGSIVAFPNDGQVVRLESGKTVTFNDTFEGSTPLDVQEHVMVFGTQVRNPVRWHLLASTARTRSAGGPPTSALERALDLYLQPGTRGQKAVTSAAEATWTLSSVPIRVEANARFAEIEDPAAPKPREYTIASFDVRPYLPDSSSAALSQVLRKADELARLSVADGIPYKQHAWSQPSDTLNLREGIDCSRAIWYAFTRAGLPYNGSDGYLSTAGMVGPSSRMKDQFDACSDDLRLGDVVVYRDAQRDTGHVVMVVDPHKRIAWGSHGWDGNVNEGKLADTGVEYQLIKYKKDWQRWDRPGMERVACWRYRRFAAEAKLPDGQPGMKALAEVCDSAKQCGRPGR
jgi:cell wall-associated NlpC family hydrolase